MSAQFGRISSAARKLNGQTKSTQHSSKSRFDTVYKFCNKRISHSLPFRNDEKADESDASAEFRRSPEPVEPDRETDVEEKGETAADNDEEQEEEGPSTSTGYDAKLKTKCDHCELTQPCHHLLQRLLRMSGERLIVAKCFDRSCVISAGAAWNSAILT